MQRKDDSGRNFAKDAGVLGKNVETSTETLKSSEIMLQEIGAIESMDSLTEKFVLVSQENGMQKIQIQQHQQTISRMKEIIQQLQLEKIQQHQKFLQLSETILPKSMQLEAKQKEIVAYREELAKVNRKLIASNGMVFALGDAGTPKSEVQAFTTYSVGKPTVPPNTFSSNGAALVGRPAVPPNTFSSNGAALRQQERKTNPIVTSTSSIRQQAVRPNTFSSNGAALVGKPAVPPNTFSSNGEALGQQGRKTNPVVTSTSSIRQQEMLSLVTPTNTSSSNGAASQGVAQVRTSNTPAPEKESYKRNVTISNKWHNQQETVAATLRRMESNKTPESLQSRWKMLLKQKTPLSTASKKIVSVQLCCQLSKKVAAAPYMAWKAVVRTATGENPLLVSLKGINQATVYLSEQQLERMCLPSAVSVVQEAEIGTGEKVAVRPLVAAYTRAFCKPLRDAVMAKVDEATRIKVYKEALVLLGKLPFRNKQGLISKATVKWDLAQVHGQSI